MDGKYGNTLMELVEILNVCTNFELVTLVTLKIKVSNNVENYVKMSVSKSKIFFQNIAINYSALMQPKTEK